MLLPSSSRLPWQRFKTWFKTFQKRWNDWAFTPLAILVFLQLPVWVNKWLYGEESHPFAADTLNTLPLALVMFCFASLISCGMFRAQYPDLFDEYTRCNEQDLLKKVVSSGESLLQDTHYITPSAYRHAWRIHTASQAILFHYF